MSVALVFVFSKCFSQKVAVKTLLKYVTGLLAITGCDIVS